MAHRRVAYLLVGVGANVVLGPHLGELRHPGPHLQLGHPDNGGPRRRSRSPGRARRRRSSCISDALIGVDKAGAGFPGRGLIVMLTYLAAQYLIATGWARRVDPDVLVPV